MQLIEVKDNKTRKEFLDAARIVYKNDDVWVCPLDAEIEAVFNPQQNNFHQHGEVIRWVLKNDKGELIGRVAAFINKNKAYNFEQPTGGMGFFECINNKEAAYILLDACRKWLNERGMEAMDGPINFGENDKFWGLLVHGFTHPAIGMPYNHSYYQEFFESYGFKKYFEQVSNHLDLTKPIPERFAKIADWVAQKEGYTFEHLKLDNIEKYASDFMDIYNEGWKFHENFVPMNRQNIKESLEKIKPIIDERLIWYAYVDNNPAAFVVVLPDANQILKHLNGKMGLLSKLKFVYHKWRGTITRIRVVILGVKPEYQKLGLESALIIKVHRLVTAPFSNYKEVELSWVGDFNPKMRALHESLGAVLGKMHYTYRCLFSDTAEFKRSTIIARDTKEQVIAQKKAETIA